MEKITHPIYNNYPEQPYISPDRDLDLWTQSPEEFPYGVVEKKQMQRLAEGLLPGDIIMLWRVHFGNFTNKSMIPEYFEYKYGVNSDECIGTLINLGYIEICSATDSLISLNMDVFKKILKNKGLDTKGKKDQLLTRIAEHIPEEELATLFPLRRYKITSSGTILLKKYDSIVQRHGPKM